MPTWIERFLSSDAARLNPERAAVILREFERKHGGNVTAEGRRPGLIEGSDPAARPTTAERD